MTEQQRSDLGRLTEWIRESCEENGVEPPRSAEEWLGTLNTVLAEAHSSPSSDKKWVESMLAAIADPELSEFLCDLEDKHIFGETCQEMQERFKRERN